MKGVSTLGAIIGSLLVAVGLAAAGWFVGQGIVAPRKGDRFVTVKGLAERDVKADLALWPMRFVATGNDLAQVRASIKADEATVRKFLTDGGVPADAVSVNALEVNDLFAQVYRSGPVENRYIVAETLLVRSTNVDMIGGLAQRVGDLVAAGVVLSSEGQPVRPVFLFTKLNDVKPAHGGRGHRQCPRRRGRVRQGLGCGAGRHPPGEPGSLPDPAARRGPRHQRAQRDRQAPPRGLDHQLFSDPLGSGSPSGIMARLLCQERPDLLDLETEILDARPGAVLLERSPFFPGGGGQLADRGTLAWQGGEAPSRASPPIRAASGTSSPSRSSPRAPSCLRADPAFRGLMSELHTLAHIVNRLVYDAFGGALLTGAQLSADATFRVDFDLPGADNDRLRALDPAIADIIRQDLAVGADWMPYDDAKAIPGMFRSKAVAPPPQADGMVRIVEIAGLDRQACGGTHLESAGRSRGARILKIENKGRHNRRVRVGLLRSTG